MKTEEEKIKDVKEQIEYRTEKLNELQKKIDRCSPKTGKLKALCQEKQVILARKNNLVNLLNILK